MGLDMHYQAIPDDCELLNLVLLGKLDGWELFSPTFYGNKDEDNMSSKERLAYLARKALANSHPNLESRSFSTRKWDIFLYFSSNKRRKTDTHRYEDDIFRRIIIGGDLLQLYPPYVYYLPSSEVKYGSQKLDAISDAELESWYIREIMESLNVYKSWQLSYQEDGFAQFLTQYNEFRNFVCSVAKYDEAIVTHEPQ